jgi:hypothetical protein
MALEIPGEEFIIPNISSSGGTKFNFESSAEKRFDVT